MEKNFIRVRSSKDIIVSVLSILAGITCILIPTGVSINILGALLIFAGLFFILALKTAYKDEETGTIYKKKEKFFPQSKKESFLKALKEDVASMDLTEEDKGNGLRVDAYYNKDRVFVQLNEYIPYKYEACSPFYKFEYAKARNLIA